MVVHHAQWSYNWSADVGNSALSRTVISDYHLVFSTNNLTQENDQAPWNHPTSSFCTCTFKWSRVGNIWWTWDRRTNGPLSVANLDGSEDTWRVVEIQSISSSSVKWENEAPQRYRQGKCTKQMSSRLYLFLIKSAWMMMQTCQTLLQHNTTARKKMKIEKKEKDMSPIFTCYDV